MDWVNFCIIVGSSAGALTGLQFVVMALIAEAPGPKDTRVVDTFGTPTVVPFCAVLLVSALLNVPWPEFWQAASAVGTCGALGIAYTLIVIRRMRGTPTYAPLKEDWAYHAVLPLLGYCALFIVAVTLPLRHVPALFGVATFTLLMLFVGIHNAWDAVTYVAVSLRHAPPTVEGRPPATTETTA